MMRDCASGHRVPDLALTVLNGSGEHRYLTLTKILHKPEVTFSLVVTPTSRNSETLTSSNSQLKHICVLSYTIRKPQ